MRYGKDYSEHLHEPIPHSHDKAKKKIELTDEMDAKEFFEKIKTFEK
jgi:hypothetical protein